MEAAGPAAAGTPSERIIPITILPGPHQKANGQHQEQNQEPSEDSRRQSLLVTLDDGTITETQGVITSLGTSSPIPGKTPTRNGHPNAYPSPAKPSRSNPDSGLKIVEIGPDTLKRELRNRSRSGSRERKPTDSPATPNVSVRIVPIRLADGTLMHRDPDETMEVRTEFTNYMHTEYPDGTSKSAPIPLPSRTSSSASESAASVSSSPARKDTTTTTTVERRRKRSSSQTKTTRTTETVTKTTEERIVPITLANGENFMPKFTTLENLEPPEWSAFHAKNRAKNPDMKETIVPIHMEDKEASPGYPRQPQSHQQSQKASSSLNSASNASSSSDNNPRSSTSRDSTPVRKLKTTTKSSKSTSSSEKKVQHTVRFNVDNDDDDDDETDEAARRAKSSPSSASRRRMHFRAGPRSTSLDSYRAGAAVGTGNAHRQASPSPVSVNRVRHPSSPATEKALHDIDRDINKIWKELQDLDTMSTFKSNSKPPIQPYLPSKRSFASSSTPHVRPPSDTATATDSLYDRTTPPLVKPLPKLSNPPSRGATVTPPPANAATSSAVTATPVKIRTYTTPTPRLPSSPNHSPLQVNVIQQQVPQTQATTHHAQVHVAAKPPQPPSYVSAPHPPAYSAQHPSAINHYTPRRDLEPTKPGTIQPITGSRKPVAKRSTSSGTSNSMPPGTTLKSVSVAANDTLKPFGNASSSSSSSKEQNNNLSQNQQPASPSPAATAKSSSKSQDNNNQMEFYPTYGMRPRAESLPRSGANDEPDSRAPPHAYDVVKSPSEAMEDKSTQTEPKAGKCSVQ